MPNSPVCVDASFLLRLLLDDEVGSRADILWETWHRERRRLVAPTLLYHEVANALHRYTAHKQSESMSDRRWLLIGLLLNSCR